MKVTSLILPIKLAVSLTTAMLIAGCATPARVEQMQVNTSLAQRTAAGSSPLRDNVAIRDVTGGKETNPMWVSNVSSADFERALEASLRDVGIWSSNRQAGRYQLVAHLEKIDQPFGGFDMTVTTTVRYTLVERASNRTVLERVVVAPYTAVFSAAFAGSERLKIANEGAIRGNIQQLITALLEFKVGDVSVQTGK